MSDDEGERPEERLADALAAYDDRLAAGQETPSDELHDTVDPSLLPEWNRLAAFLTLVEQAWPRTGEDPDRRTEPIPPGSSPDEVSPDVEAAGRFGRFRILRTLGQGGFGIVFLAWDPNLRRQIALKVPLPESLVTPEARKRFLREAHAAAGLDHPHIVPVYETGRVGTVAYIAAAYCPGPTLAEWLARQGRPVPPRDAARLVATLARAAEHAHERGVLHRDLKPSNVLLQRPPGTNEPSPSPGDDDALSFLLPRITDFGLAWLANGEGPETQSGVPIGSPPYMAPEQAEGRLKAIGPATDVYGLGCILHELCIGHPPFRGENQLDTLRQVIADDPIPLRRARADIPVELDAIVLKCLEKPPTRRYPTARALAEDLDRFLAGEPTRARPPGRWEILSRTAKRHPAALVISIISVVSAAALLGAGHVFKTRLDESRQILRQREDDVRRNDLGARQARYVADVRQAARFVSQYQPLSAVEHLRRHTPKSGEDDVREFGWYHLWRRCHTERRTLPGRRSEVYHVEFSPRGDLLASGGKDGMVRIWDTTTWKVVLEFTASPKEVNVATFSPDGKALATADDDGKVKLWEIATGNLKGEFLAHTADALDARFTPNGKTIITAGPNEGFVKLWDLASGVMVGRFEGKGYLLSPDGGTLASLGAGDVLNLRDFSTRGTIRSFPIGPRVHGWAFSHDGTRLATAHEDDRVVRLWDVSGRVLLELRGHTAGATAVSFSLDDRTIISAGDDGTIRLWDVATGAQRGVHMGHAGRAWTLAVSPDGGTIASAGRDGTVKLWDTEAPDGPPRLPIPEPASLGFSPDGQTLLTLEMGPQPSIVRWDALSGSPRGRTQLDVIGGSHSASAFSADGRSLAIAHRNGAITLWDATTGLRRGALARPSGGVKSLELSPDGRGLLVHDDRNVFSLVNLASRIAIPFPGGTPSSAQFTQTGELLTRDAEGTVLRWDPRTGRTRPLRLDRPRHFTFAALSPDLRHLAAAEPYRSEILVWPLEPPGRRVSLKGHASAGNGPLAFSPDGETLASAGRDETVKLWDVATGEELLTLEGYRGPVGMLRFSPDGKALATLSGTGLDQPGEIILWHAAAYDDPPAE